MIQIKDSDLDRYYPDPQCKDDVEDREPVDECVFCGDKIFEDEWVLKLPDYGTVCECCIEKYKFRA